MKKNFFKIKFHKMDEMERYILFRAQRNAYIFLSAAVFIWSLYESFSAYVYHTELNLLPLMLLVVSIIIQTFSQLIMTRNAVKDDEDSYETKPLLKIIVLICVIISVLITIGTAVISMSVRL